MSGRDAWIIRRLMTGQADEGEREAASESLRPFVRHLNALPLKSRQPSLDAFLLGRPDADVIRKALSGVDPLGPIPEGSGDDGSCPGRWATAADVRMLMAETRWAWVGWIPGDGVMGVAGFEGTGKTRFALDVCRRIYSADVWPDGQVATLPKGTRSLWLCADGHHGELVETMAAFGLPDEAVLFPAPAEDPYGGTDLDADETLKALESVILSHRPGLVVVDTLTSATGKDLCSQAVMKDLKSPLVKLCQSHGVVVMLLLHVSKEGQALGRRVKGITRTLLHLECPDPRKAPERLRLWVEKSFAKKPPALGVTMTETGNGYDFDPPSAPEPARGGRPSAEREKAKEFITEALTRDNDRRATELCDSFVVGGFGKKTTFWEARDDLVAEGRIVCEGKPLVLHLVRNADPE